MKCPICNIDMRLHEREGMEIDECPKCGGVYLDQGEIEELIKPFCASNSEDVRPRRLGRDYFFGKAPPKRIEEAGRLPPEIFVG